MEEVDEQVHGEVSKMSECDVIEGVFAIIGFCLGIAGIALIVKVSK